MDVINQIIQCKIIAIIRGIESERIIDTCEALARGGVTAIEVTFNQSRSTGNQETYDAIKQIAKELPEVCLGAGTVMTIEQVELAVEAGARYIISPNFDRAIVKRTIELGAISIPGVLTPTEISEAYSAGASFAKLFPAGTLGIEYLKAIKAPLSHIPMLAVGGIDVHNVSDFMKIGLAGVGIGSSLVNPQLIKNGKYNELTELAKEFVRQIKE